MSKETKLFAWDFHGTLEKDNENAVLEISNAVLEQMGLDVRLTEEDNFKLYGKKWSDYFAYLLPDEPEETHLLLQKKCLEYEDEYPQIINNYIKPTDHAHYVLTEIAKKHEQILVSNMSDVALVRFLEAVDMTKFFPEGKAFATNSQTKRNTSTKKEIIAKYLKNRSFDQIIAIGDTHIDIEMGKSVGATTYLYMHPGREFVDVEADYKIRDLREVLNEL